MNRRAATSRGMAWMLATGVVVAAVACLPDLPSDRPAPAVTAPAQSAEDPCGDGFIDLARGEQCDPGPGAGDAGVGGCTADCQMICDGGMEWPVNHHCYERVPPGALALQSNAVSASDLCQQSGGHVVTFASDDEFAAVIGRFDGGPFWVGLAPGGGAEGYKPVSPDLGEPGWAPTCPGCFAHGVEGGAPLPVFPGPPDAGTTGCVVASTDPVQPWQAFPCSLTNAERRSYPEPQVICEREPVGKLSAPCEAGTCFDLVPTLGAKHYVYQDNYVSSDDARAGCVAMGGRLVVLQSQNEREELWRELSHQTVQPNPGVWIGLAQVVGAAQVGTDTGHPPAAAWQWEDEQPVAAYPSEWGTGEPRTAGAVSSRAFLWQTSNADDTLAHDDLAFSTLPYVCEIPAAAPAPADAGAGY